MFHLLFGLIFITQGGQQPSVPKAPTPIQVSYREASGHLAPEKFPYLRVQSTANLFAASIRVEIQVDAEGNVVAARASRDNWRDLKLPPDTDTFDQAEVLVRGLHFKPFESGGRPVPANVEFYVSLLPPELKPAKHVPFPAVKDWNSLKITLSRTTCFGSCPSYKVEVHGDGTVLYQGGGHVAFTGEHRGTVSVDNVMELVKLFEQADYFSLDDNYFYGVTDNPTYTTSIEFDGLHKQVVDYVGLQAGMPMAVADLEAAIDRLSGSERWTKGNSDRGKK